MLLRTMHHSLEGDYAPMVPISSKDRVAGLAGINIFDGHSYLVGFLVKFSFIDTPRLYTLFDSPKLYPQAHFNVFVCRSLV